RPSPAVRRSSLGCRDPRGCGAAGHGRGELSAAHASRLSGDDGWAESSSGEEVMHEPASMQPEMILQRVAEHLGQDDGAARDVLPAELRELQRELTRFRLRYKFALDEITTKLRILQEEFEQTHSHSPIEHVRTRLKSAESMMSKAMKRGCEPTLESIAEKIQDIAGARVVCPFISDVYWIKDMLAAQADVTILEVKDYIA